MAVQAPDIESQTTQGILAEVPDRMEYTKHETQAKLSNVTTQQHTVNNLGFIRFAF